MPQRFLVLLLTMALACLGLSTTVATARPAPAQPMACCTLAAGTRATPKPCSGCKPVPTQDCCAKANPLPIIATTSRLPLLPPEHERWQVRDALYPASSYAPEVPPPKLG